MSVYSTAQLCIHCKQTVKLCLNPLKSIWSSINFHAQYSQIFLATTCPISLYVSTWVITWGLPSLDRPYISISMAIGQTNHKYPRNLTYTCQFWLKVVIKKTRESIWNYKKIVVIGLARNWKRLQKFYIENDRFSRSPWRQQNCHMYRWRHCHVNTANSPKYKILPS